MIKALDFAHPHAVLNCGRIASMAMLLTLTYLSGSSTIQLFLIHHLFPGNNTEMLRFIFTAESPLHLSLVSKANPGVGSSHPSKAILYCHKLHTGQSSSELVE